MSYTLSNIDCKSVTEPYKLGFENASSLNSWGHFFALPCFCLNAQYSLIMFVYYLACF